MSEIADHDLVERIYDGAMGADRFGPALSDLADRIGAGGANVHVVDKSNLSTLVFLPVGEKYTQAAIDEYFTHWRHLNPYRAAMRRCAGVFLCHEHVSESELSRSAYARDFYFAIGERWLAGLVRSDGCHDVSLVFNRGPESARFGDRERREIERFAPHVRRAAKLLAARRGASHGLSDVFANATVPAWLLAGDGRVVWANEAALDVMRGRGAVRERSGRLVVNDTAAQGDFTTRLRDACARVLTPAKDPIACPHAGGRLDLEVYPATAPEPGQRNSAALALVLGKPRGIRVDAPALLRRRFDLTPAEARLAIEVASGAALEDIARARKVSFQTVRTQLRTVFSKTETSRQGALCALVWRELSN